MLDYFGTWGRWWLASLFLRAFPLELLYCTCASHILELIFLFFWTTLNNVLDIASLIYIYINTVVLMTGISLCLLNFSLFPGINYFTVWDYISFFNPVNNNLIPIVELFFLCIYIYFWIGVIFVTNGDYLKHSSIIWMNF